MNYYNYLASTEIRCLSQKALLELIFFSFFLFLPSLWNCRGNILNEMLYRVAEALLCGITLHSVQFSLHFRSGDHWIWCSFLSFSFSSIEWFLSKACASLTWGHISVALTPKFFLSAGIYSFYIFITPTKCFLRYNRKLYF